MDLKPRSDHREHLETLRRLGPVHCLKTAGRMSEVARSRLKEAIRREFPALDEHELHALYLERLERCRTMNF